jgi:hypothetical protein
MLRRHAGAPRIDEARIDRASIEAEGGGGWS